MQSPDFGRMFKENLSPPVRRAARLLRHIAEGEGMRTMTQAIRALGINRTTLLRLLHTLEAERFIEPAPMAAAASARG